ncbi:unnamed protein product [Oppiella nova]|uniref:Mediator complex subunit Med25 PTOV domain-containing protein n=1 Tax=Oppiella nova TaxID=334625 RepID=A0A7R9LF34_9ACAR|nr:unnamed protein product [Oppiella nova]CAG2162905.1 unnamed protein product [Oppiella nova]
MAASNGTSPLQHPFPQPSPPMNATIHSHPTPPAPTTKAHVWTGIMDYKETPLQPGPSTGCPRDTHSLYCNITCHAVNGVPEVYGHEWPQQLLLSLVPKQLIMSLFPMLKSSAYHITLHFADDQHPGLSKLIAIMSSNWIGCIQLAGLSIRMIIVLYNPDKRIFMGFVPHNQQEFFDTMKEIVEDHKKRKNDPTMSPTIMPSIDPKVVSNRSREMDARSSQVFDNDFVNEIKNEMKAEIMREIKSGIMSEFAVKLKNEIKCELKTELLLEIESEVKYKKIKTESNCDDKDSMHSNDFLALDYL